MTKIQSEEYDDERNSATKSTERKASPTESIPNPNKVAIEIKPDMIEEHQEALKNGQMIDESQSSSTSQMATKIIIAILLVGFIIIDKRIISNMKAECVIDKIMNALQFANDFINTPGNEKYRDFCLSMSSFVVDGTFITSFGYWLLYGKTGRLPVAVGCFFFFRVLNLQAWHQPFPQGFFWNETGMPTITTPYGRSSDFFFSGHSGFVLICLEEWNTLKKYKMRNITLVALIYCVACLLIYRCHYSIDVFVGLFFADWMYWRIDSVKHIVDTIPNRMILGVKFLYNKIKRRDNAELLDEANAR